MDMLSGYGTTNEAQIDPHSHFEAVSSTPEVVAEQRIPTGRILENSFVILTFIPTLQALRMVKFRKSLIMNDGSENGAGEGNRTRVSFAS